MKTNLGGDRLGSGGKQQISTKTYNRSTHDLSSLWRSSMAAGTLVPFMSELALPGDTWDINLNAECLTLPTIGPLFGSFKLQLDVFEVPIRLYNAGLHMNRLGIGLDMADVYLPRIQVFGNNHTNYQHTYEDNEHIGSSCILKYLGISGLGHYSGTYNPARRYFNATPLLMYWDIYKNYYANKQEEVGYVIHTTSATGTFSAALLYNDGTLDASIYNNPALHTGATTTTLEIQFSAGALEPDPSEIDININAVGYKLDAVFSTITWDDSIKTLFCSDYDTSISTSSVNWEVPTQTPIALGGLGEQITLQSFALSGIDDIKEDILQHPFASGVFTLLAGGGVAPYSYLGTSVGANEDLRYSYVFSQEGLGIKTYQSDLFNNWIDTDWIDNASTGINAITSVDTTGNSFTIDSLNLANKVYNMLNRVAVSGGTYDDWLDAVYTHDRIKAIDSPVYHGSLIKELAFQEVISNSEVTFDGQTTPLGTLAGRGQLTSKNKGGKMIIKTSEPSYIMGIVSLTPRIDYSQGNKWDMNLETFDDFHKPELSAIGFQDLVTDAMCWSDTLIDESTGACTYRSAGKQPAWLNYMTNVNKTYGHFADQNKDMFMTLNRRYEKNTSTGRIADLTTYIDPTKYNHIFAQTDISSQNFWVQISKNITCRRKMSAKVIPNL